jgi:hypothetical protein
MTYPMPLEGPHFPAPRAAASGHLFDRKERQARIWPVVLLVIFTAATMATVFFMIVGSPFAGAATGGCGGG